MPILTVPGEDRFAGAHQWRHHLINANGTQLHVVEAGPVDSVDAVMLVHGFPQCWWSWRYQISALASAGIRVIAIDLRGCGGSDRQHDGYDLPTLTLDCIGAMANLGVRHYLVAGTGLGAHIAWVAPLYESHAIRSVVTFASPHPLEAHLFAFRGGVSAWWRQAQIYAPFVLKKELARGSQVRRFLRRGVGANLQGQQRVLDYADFYAQLLRSRVAAARSVDYLRKSLRASPTLKKLCARGVGVPVTCVWGDADRLNGTSGRVYARDQRWTRAGYQQIRVEGGGHFLPEEFPDLISDILLWAVQETWPERAGGSVGGGSQAVEDVSVASRFEVQDGSAHE